jgi:hypothetical protein
VNGRNIKLHAANGTIKEVKDRTLNVILIQVIVVIFGGISITYTGRLLNIVIGIHIIIFQYIIHHYAAFATKIFIVVTHP